MSNTPYKKTLLSSVYAEAPSLATAYPSTLLREPWARTMRAQDTGLNGRRLLISQHMGGCDEWLVDNAATGGVSQSKPDAVTWRVAARARTELMSGSALVARCIAVPSGMTEALIASFYEDDGVQGAIRFVIDYLNTTVQSDTVTVQFGLTASEDATGKEDLAAGAAWEQLIHRWRTNVRPAAVLDGSSELAKWSEWPTITVSVEHRGGARVVHASICEEPLEHAVADTVTASTCHGTDGSLLPTIAYPVEKEADGVTYDENRHGVHRLLHVAARQSARVGPRICHWSAYSEELAEVADTEADAISVTSTTPVRVSWRDANANTRWDADCPGYDLPQTRRAPENLSTRVSGAASSPVRLRVYARFSAAGTNTGYLRIQSSPRSWITASISQATVGTTWTWITITGWLESAVAGDDDYVIAQDFAWVGSGPGTLELRYWDLSYGDYAVGT